MSQQLIKIWYSLSGETVQITIPAIVRGPLALHRTVESTRCGFVGAVGSGWAVTHIASGRRIYWFHFPQAARWAFRLLCRIDWESSAQQKSNGTYSLTYDAMKRVQEIIRNADLRDKE